MTDTFGKLERAKLYYWIVDSNNNQYWDVGKNRRDERRQFVSFEWSLLNAI
jgi:hypothetical protein